MAEGLSWKNNMYRITMEKEQLEQAYKALVESNAELKVEYNEACTQLKESDRLLGEKLQRVKQLSEELKQVKSKYAELESAATTVVDFIYPTTPGVQAQQLVEHLQTVPSKFIAYVRKTCSIVGTQILAVVQSFYPTAELDEVPDGKSEDCTQEQFEEYEQTLKPIVNKVVAKLDLS
ncbi:unnamed protein product [Urochloa decumbens]